ncbi:MAG: NAD(P)H-hydrate epimerase [Candidatus Hodarchaeales archaeon]|jgi:NAD(P)H-hydrate epimerase
MALPGITKNQMIEVDRLMIEEKNVPVELMMEHAGTNLARLAIQVNTKLSKYQVIVGSGNNGGGGLVAARRLAAWGLDVEIFIPKSAEKLRNIPKLQFDRAQKVGVKSFDGIPSVNTKSNCNNMILDCYIGYSFQTRLDDVSDQVFAFLSANNNVISLDVPSGFDVTTGKNFGGIIPMTTLTIAFMKQGLLNAPKESLEDLYIVDIGVPSDIYRYNLEIDWSQPFDILLLDRLDEAFARDPLQKVFIQKIGKQQTPSWNIF